MRLKFSAIFFVLVACVSCESSTSPPSTPSVRFTTVSVGAYHACALDDQQRAWCWGESDYGEVGVPPHSCVWGNGTVTPCPQLMTLIRADMRFTSISAGNQATCGVRTDGAGYCWGADFRDQLGASPRPATTCFVPLACSVDPLPVTGGLTFGQITVGFETTCGVTTSGIGVCWGSTYGMNLNTSTTTATPRAITRPATGDSSWSWIGGGTSSNNCGVSAANELSCWGINTYGALGNGSIATNSSGYGMAVVAAPSPLHGVTAGDNFACGLDAAGAAFCWGYSSNGSLGVGNQGYTLCGYSQSVFCFLTPTAVKGGLTFAMLSAGANHVCGVTLAADAYCWGNNMLGESGAPTSVNIAPQPTLVTGSNHFAMVSSGTSSSCGVTTDGGVWCWGANVAAQPGDIYTYSSTPFRILPP